MFAATPITTSSSYIFSISRSSQSVSTAGEPDSATNEKGAEVSEEVDASTAAEDGERPSSQSAAGKKAATPSPSADKEKAPDGPTEAKTSQGLLNKG